jgi:Flp pilus assembly protein TadG
MKNIIQKLLSDQRGASIILFAFMAFILVGVTALVTDVGKLTAAKRELAAAADASALAGAQELVKITKDDTPSELSDKLYQAKVKAAEYAIINIKEYANLTETERNEKKAEIIANTTGPNSCDVKHTSTDKYVSVSLRNDIVELYFARIFNKSIGAVSASAKATYEYPMTFQSNGGSGNLGPICTTKYLFDKIMVGSVDGVSPLITVKDKGVLSIPSGDIADGSGDINGNWGLSSYYDNSGDLHPGANIVKYLLSGGYDGKDTLDLSSGEYFDVSTKLNTQTGSITGPIKYDVELRLNNASHIFLIPIVGTVPKSGSTDVTILGYCCFELTGVTAGGDIQGVFRGDIPVGDFIGKTTTSETYNYGAKVILLVK